MYGKAYESTFTGSMAGKGAVNFSVLFWIISHQRPAGEFFQVELNPIIMAAAIGEPVECIRSAIEFHCQPDPESRSKADDGRRIVKIGSFDYRVVNGRKYHEIKKESERREQNRIRQERHRAKKTGKINTGDDGKPASGKYMAGETAAIRQLEETGTGEAS